MSIELEHAITSRFIKLNDYKFDIFVPTIVPQKNETLTLRFNIASGRPFDVHFEDKVVHEWYYKKKFTNKYGFWAEVTKGKIRKQRNKTLFFSKKMCPGCILNYKLFYFALKIQ